MHWTGLVSVVPRQCWPVYVIITNDYDRMETNITK